MYEINYSPLFQNTERFPNKLARDIQKAINGEYSAILCYEELAKKARTQDERNQIIEIQQDEKRHFKEFLKIYKNLTGNKAELKVTEECPDAYLKGVQAAFKDEQETVDFYLDIAYKADDKMIKETFRRAAADEQQHAVWFLYFLTSIPAHRQYRQTAEIFGAKGALNAASLSLPEMLTFAMQDEYLAQTRYDLILNRFGEIRTFSRIKQAELRHISALQPLFLTYGVPLPSDTSSLYATVPSTIKQAYAEGVQGEIDNIAMYNKFLAYNLPADVQFVFTQLRNASLNHLAAFERGLARN